MDATRHSIDPLLAKQHSEDLQELYRRSWPTWTRPLVISGILACFILYAASWAFNAINYSTKEETKEIRQELKQELRDINGKLDSLISQRQK